MSSLSNVPYGKILDYWYERLSNNPFQIKFLLTKIIEIIAFKKYSTKQNNNNYQYIDFPLPIANNIPQNPTISIVVPTYIKNQKDINDIENLLQSISKQSISPNNVIIVDDCSPIEYSFPKHIQVYRQPENSGPAKARNFGKKIALENNSDVIAFTDTDCILSKNWIEAIISEFQNSKKAQILSGNTISYDKNWFGIYHNINGTLNGRKFINSEQLLYGTTANLAITRQVAEDVNFNEEFPLPAGEDIEFCFRANQNGFAIKYNSQMVISHNYGYTTNLFQNLKSFNRQFRRYGQGETTLLNEIPEYYAYFDKTEEITAL
ncbi:glycosyltransferase family 2 protein [Bacteroides sp. 224]|uniref:glycosyltransferase family 2 protein n=1 Tax=Bacteroides sp. 224 TaxID=2302936 RepID=UPI0013D46E3D|nr:glycosyltransferase family A protein [Bacteroides sp. 224]